ncbi:hypothetical protein CKW47_21315, partial [Bordetella pertussis]
PPWTSISCRPRRRSTRRCRWRWPRWPTPAPCTGRPTRWRCTAPPWTSISCRPRRRSTRRCRWRWPRWPTPAPCT